MSAQEIIQIANELSARGITPSTAMVKARLSHPVPMAELLKVLSQWKQQPQSTDPAPTSAPASAKRGTVSAAGSISGAASVPSENDPATSAEKASIARWPWS